MPQLVVTKQVKQKMALGTPIATFYRAKSAEFSAENALFDMNLMSTQLGTKKKIAGTEEVATILVPAMESFTVTAEGTYKLKHTPKVAPTEIYALNADSTFGVKYNKATAATATEFAIDGRNISVIVNEDPEKGIPVGTEMFVMYEYEAKNAVEVVNSATEFPVGCKFVMEVLGCDVCDQTNLRVA